MSWLDFYFGGYNTLQSAGVSAIQRKIANFIGVTIADNPGTGATDITVLSPDQPILVAPVTIKDVTDETVIEIAPSGSSAVLAFGPDFQTALIIQETPAGTGSFSSTPRKLALKAADGQDVTSGTNNPGAVVQIEYGSPGSGGSGGAYGFYNWGDTSRVAGIGLHRCPYPDLWGGTLLACKQATSGSYKIISVASDDLTLGDAAFDTVTIDGGTTSCTAKVNGTPQLTLTPAAVTLAAPSGSVQFVTNGATSSIDNARLELGTGVAQIIYKDVTTSISTNDGSTAQIDFGASGMTLHGFVQQPDTETFAYRASDSAGVSTSTVVVADGVLKLPVGTNQTWEIEAFIRSTCSAGGGVRHTLKGPAGATTPDIFYFANYLSIFSAAALAFEFHFTGPTDLLIIMRAVVTTVGTGGFVEVYYAQDTSDATATVNKAGSFIRGKLRA